MRQNQEQLEAKYEQKRKAYKELESNQHKQIAEIQKEKAVLDEKLQNSELKKEEVRVKLENEIVVLKEQLALAGDQVGKDREIFMGENERLKATL